MANIRKTFNFRNGVQVDEDNLVVNSLGLVGIGTSVPTEILDVRGTVKVVGLVTANDVFVSNLNVSGITTLRTVNIGIVSVTSGIITASSGIVTYYGDGSGLTNIPTSQWIDVNLVGTAYSSIYAAGTVGIATNMPNYFLQVGNDPDISNGIGINSTGDVKTTGIVTASFFSGSGIRITQINANNIESGTLSNNRLPSNISVSGIITATNFVGSITGNLTGIAQSATSLTGTPNINVGVITATKIIVDTIDVISSPSGITTIASTLNVGVGGTGFTALNAGRIGVGTAIPTSELQIRKTSNSLIEVISDTNQARISIGQSVGVGKSTAVLRFGNSTKTFDIINNDTGNINMYLHNGTSGIGTGRFSWLYGQTNDELLSLNYDGTLTATGDVFLGSAGISTVTVQDNLYVSGDVNVNGTLTATINYPDVIPNTNLNAISGITTLQKLNVTANIGINTENPLAGLDASGVDGIFSGVGIGTTVVGDNSLLCEGTAIFSSSIGIGTTSIYTGDVQTGSLQVHNNSIRIFGGRLLISNQNLSGIGFGTHNPKSILDFGNVGSATSLAYFIPPTVTNTGRNTFADTVGLTTSPGAIIYNATEFRHQGYGSTDGGLTFAWYNLY